jgi:hypothetical protein
LTYSFVGLETLVGEVRLNVIYDTDLNALLLFVIMNFEIVLDLQARINEHGYLY